MRLVAILAFVAAQSAFGAEASVVTLDNGVQVIKSAQHTYYTGYKNLKPAHLRGLGETKVTLNDCDNLPEEFDLRDIANVVPATRDQGQCGSCWAFSKTGSLASSIAANGGSPLVLSEQELVSCDTQEMGCDGGNLDGFGFQIQNGQALNKDFPYSSAGGSTGSCKDGLKPAAQGVSYVNVGADSSASKVTQTQCALFKSHTIPWITVAASDSWDNPPTGDTDLYTSCATGEINHAVGIIGWKTVNGKVYFKMRNSWGTSWGSTANRPGAERGFMMMQLGCDSLGDEIAYIQTKATGCMAPNPKLPAEITVARGGEAALSVEGENGVDYQWLQGAIKVATGNSATVAPTVDTVYKVVAKNACGTAESQVRVKIQ